MAKDKKKEEEKVIVAEFKVSMHCNACERSVAKAISKFKGVEKFTTDMNKHQVTITGMLNEGSQSNISNKRTQPNI
ncbi:hypothetical protein CCACVL1_28380 [Corchorus capsularis]|uniref:HMA domain-containing protein n=1 Tax=Corchorus capsularis TaxID=210143 RepID=A0A1R3G6Q9_COCAP|nr:hypothetical protein CCACVL1_28380 [Corchorus capsularis]